MHLCDLELVSASLSLSFSSGPCWGGTAELLRADGGSRGLPQGEARPGLRTRTTEPVGALPLDPPWAHGRQGPAWEPQARCSGDQKGDPGQVNWPRVQGGLPGAPGSWTRPLGNSAHCEAAGTAGLASSSPSSGSSQEGPTAGRGGETKAGRRDRWASLCGPKGRATADSRDHWRLSWARVLEVAPSSFLFR